MHEYSIVQSLLDSCEEHARENNSTNVTKVIVKIGVLSGVEPDLLQTAFDTFKEKTVCEKAEFIINHQKVVISCLSCDEETTLEKHVLYTDSKKGAALLADWETSLSNFMTNLQTLINIIMLQELRV